MTSTDTKVDPIAERAQLTAEIQNAVRTVAECKAKRATLAATSKDLLKRRGEAMAAFARGREHTESVDDVETLMAM